MKTDKNDKNITETESRTYTKKLKRSFAVLLKVDNNGFIMVEVSICLHGVTVEDICKGIPKNVRIIHHWNPKVIDMIEFNGKVRVYFHGVV
jgi:hypothetical protein